jgi:multiple sugar transport system ATP-binding protein
VKRAAEQLHITEYLDRKPKALSGGQRQRVAMGRAMVRNPQVFLFDEPLSNLDAKLRGEVRTEIKALAQTLMTTMIFVTHDQVEAMTMADRIVILKSGIVQQVGTPQQVYNEPANAFVAGFIGSPTMNFFDARRGEGGLRLTDGLVLPLPAARAATLGDRQSVQFGVRPEHLRPRAPGSDTLAVKVSVVEPLGSDTLVFFEFDGRRHVARFAPEETPKAGDTVHLGIAMDRAHLFDKTSGVALR